MKTGMPNWNDLRILLEVSRSSTLAGAARKLGVDDSTISRRIAALETALDVVVFERDHLGFRVTSKGQELLDSVQEMEAGALALTEKLSGQQRLPVGKVRVATMEGIASLYLAGEFVKLHSRYPDLQIELVTSANLVQVSRREADLFVSFFFSHARGVHSSVVGEFQLRLYASLSYLQAHGTPGSAKELQNHRFVTYIDDLVQLDTVRWLNEVVPNPDVRFHSTSMLSQMFHAAAGGGIVMLPDFARPEKFGLNCILRDEIRVVRKVWLSVHRDLQFAGRIKAVTAFIQETLGRDFPATPESAEVRP